MEFTNNYKLPDSVEDIVIKSSYDITKRDFKRLSVTTLLQPPRIRMLTLKHYHEIKEDISDHIWRILGSSVHEVLEKAVGEDRSIEEKIEIEIGGAVVVGKIDLYNKKTKTIMDWKVTSCWSVIFEPKGKKDWIEQLNIYAFLMRSKGYEVNKLQITTILRDWNKSKSKIDSDYPKISMVVINIPLWTFEEQEKFLKERIKLHLEVKDLSDDNLPLCSQEERWGSLDKYAVLKIGGKRALKLFEDSNKACEYLQYLREKNNELIDKFYIQKRIGKNRRCEEYCPVNKWCSFYQNIIKENK